MLVLLAKDDLDERKICSRNTISEWDFGSKESKFRVINRSKKIKLSQPKNSLAIIKCSIADKGSPNPLFSTKLWHSLQ